MRTSVKSRSPYFLVAGLLCVSLWSSVAIRAVETLPAQLNDREFWQLVNNLSEPDGYFHSDNFVSNERSFQQVLAELAEGRQPGSAYIGVGPEQNFTYLLAVKPRIAFIVDIRRQNLIEHLMYKAIFELSTDRAGFLSRLLSRRRPENLNRDATVVGLFNAFGRAPIDPQLVEENLSAIRNRLVRDHGFALSREDEASLERVYRAFNVAGANLTYDGPVPSRGLATITGFMPTFEELMMETDREGMHRSFLANEESFRLIQELQKKNLIVPVVGNFAGPSALRSIGQYLREHDATVTSFYTSNVEQYLFMEQTWKRFYANVSALPVTPKSVIIRGVIRSATGELSSSPALPPTSRYETHLFPIDGLVAAFNNGTIEAYDDILTAR